MTDLSTTTYILIAVILVAVQIIGRLLDKYVLKSDNHMLKELWKWHAPDSTGVQSWKNPGMAEALGELNRTQTEILKTLQEMAGDMAHVAGRNPAPGRAHEKDL